MAKHPSQGTCSLCKGTFGRAAMSRHLAKCVTTHGEPQQALAKENPRTTRIFHLLVEGGHDPKYWLHLEVPATATLHDLDGFLRHIWLDCCGHLSMFMIGKTRYCVQMFDDQPDFDTGFGERDMNVELGKVLHPGLKLSYEYDFGSTTALTLKVVSEREGKVRKQDSVRLLARNDPPVFACRSCGAPATKIDAEVAWEGGGWICDRCAEDEGLDDGLLPVVNSPRVGVCGYTGEETEWGP